MGDVADCAAIELDIENITGVSDANDDFIRSAQKFVVSSIPSNLLLFASKQSSTYTGGGGVAANIDGIVEVQRNGYSCKQISIQESKWASDSTSLKYATSKHPVWWFDSNVVKILPEPSGSDDGYYYYIDYTEINDDSDLRNAVVYRACSNEFSKLATDGVPSWTSPSLPVPPSTADFGSDLNISSSPPVSPTITASTVDTSGWTTPSYTKPVLSITSNPSITDLDISSSLPVSPASPSFTYTDASATDVVKPIISISDMASLTASAPSYSKPVHTLTSFPSITWSFPASPVPPSISVQTVDDYTTEAPSYTQPVLSLEAKPTVSSLSISAVPPDVPSLSAITFASIDGEVNATIVPVAAGGTLGSSTSPTFTAPTVGGVTEELTAALTALTGDALATDADFLDVSKWFTAVGEMIEDEEDLELASAQLQKISTYINAYQAQVQSNLHEFNEANVKFQASVQESLAEFQSANQIAIGNAERSQGRQFQNSVNDMKVIFDGNAQSISKYQAELQQYQAEVNSEVQEFSQNLGKELQLWQTNRQTETQKYSHDIQNALNTFNKENTIYQATLQEKIQEAQLKDSNESKKLQKYQNEIKDYETEVNKVVSGNQAQIAEWQQRNATSLQQYSIELQNELNSFNKENVEYQQDIQRKLENLKKDTQEAVQNAQNEIAVSSANLNKDVQINLQNAVQDFQQDVQEYSAKMQKYSSEVQSYQQDVNKQVQEYTINEIQKELAIWNTNIQSDLQSYTSNIQNELNEFNKELQIYQAEVQASIQDAQLESAEEAQKIQKYSAELNQYQQDMNKEIQDFVNTLNKETQEYQSKIALYGAELQKYQSEITDKTQEGTFKTQNVQYYEKQADKYYTWAQTEITQYIQNNSKMINQTIAAQAQAQQQQQYRS
jgi:hypothetical protein|tara:strand:+ start:1068 stop:3764 length:2697 start_codon:yes stop_codon:yes gene_type:complete